MGLPADTSASPAFCVPARPTQSEFVLQQFGTINVYSDGRIVDRWPALPLSDRRQRFTALIIRDVRTRDRLR